MTKAHKTVGKRFGRLKIVRRVESNKWGQTRFECRCDCGTVKTIVANAFRSGRTVSCGCLRNETVARLNRSHGLKSVKPHKLYLVWRGIKTRCFNPNATAFKNYGAKGISIAPEWKDDAVAFIEWALANGWAPHLTIDRKDRRGDYAPLNIEFVSKSENSRRLHRDNRCDKNAVLASSQLSFGA